MALLMHFLDSGGDKSGGMRYETPKLARAVPAMRICYCERCGVRIPEEDIASGRAASQEAERFLCAKCSPAREPPASTVSGRAHGAPTGHAPASHRTRVSAAQRTKDGGGAAKWVVIGAAVLVSVGVVLFLTVGGNEPAAPRKPAPAPAPRPAPAPAPIPPPGPEAQPETTPPSPALPAPEKKGPAEEESPRDAMARRGLEAVKAYAKEHPDDPWTYGEMLADFLSSYRSTPAGKEAVPLQAELKLASRAGSPLAHWKFDEAEGAPAQDAAGAFPATLKGQTRRVAGRIGSGAVAFGGDPDDYVDLGSGPGLNFAAGAPFTVSCWVKTEATCGTLVSFRNSKDQTTVMDLAVGFDGAAVAPGCLMALVRQDGGKDLYGRVAGAQVNAGTWHHVALTRGRGGVIRLFLDGVLQGSSANQEAGGSITTDLRCCGAERFWVLANANTRERQSLAGEVDDLRIYGCALTESELRELMNAK